EPVQAPPEPYHILAQQLMALCLQERGIGRSEWLGWIDAVPAFSQMNRAAVTAIVDFMIASQIIWSDGGILAFAPEGEAKFGRRNFMDLLSVFTSPPLFRVSWGRKELGFVHESTFFKRDGGPTVLLLAGRCWQATHLDWRRRVAHVEPTEQVGKSRWLGEGQFLGHRVCQAVRETLAGDEVDPHWSRRAVARIGEVREEFPWLRPDSTALVRHPDGQVRWWTFAGGVANTILAQQLGRFGEAKADNTAITIEGDPPMEEIREHLGSLSAHEMAAVPDPRAIEILKFSEALPPVLSERVYLARFNDETAIRDVLADPLRMVSEG
ncbi:MAG: ATP-dependent helicase, partial [Isosphaeraceae bacterium]